MSQTTVAAAPNTATLKVSVAYARRLFDMVERFGLPRAALLRKAQVGHADWDAPQERLPLADLIALFESALTLTGRRDLVLEFGRQVRPDTFDVLGYALMTCRTLGEAIDLVPLYGRVVFDPGYSETRFDYEGANVKLAWVVLPQATEAGLPYSDLLTESLIASWFRLGRWIAGTDLPLLEVRFRHASPEDTLPFETFFDCPVRFAAGENALLFSSDLLAKPLVRADAELNLAMRHEARKVIDRLHLSEDIGAQVRQMLVSRMPTCEASLKYVASGLGITPRTLQRRLARADFSFQAVLDDTRRELAQVYLRDPALSALDVALLLGYAEQSSFTRAFKSWFGETPTAYRQNK